MTLHPNQERAVAIRLRLLEERLALVRHLMDVDEQGVLYRRDRAAFTPDERAPMAAPPAATHAEIASLAGLFGLPREEQDARRRIVGLLAISRQGLGDIQGPGLRGHGEVAPALRERLDPGMERLLQLFMALEKRASGSE